MNKTELIAAIAEDTNLSKADAGRAFDSALEHLSRALVRVMISRRAPDENSTKRDAKPFFGLRYSSPARASK